MSISKPFISVVIPTFNEELYIYDCLKSLEYQKLEIEYEVIVVDDGSEDGTVAVIRNLSKACFKTKIKLLMQDHSGPGIARNFGVKQSKGNIIVFVDADMTFDEMFLFNLTKKIISQETIGTDSQEEFLSNAENFWARCWNIGRFAKVGNFSKQYLTTLVPNKYDSGGVYRAILKSEFNKVGGFSSCGDYSDDLTLSLKLGQRATLAEGAIFFHRNPASVREVWQRACWIGNSKEFNKNLQSQVVNLFKFFPLVSILKGIYISLRFRELNFILFKIIYDTRVWLSILKNI